MRCDKCRHYDKRSDYDDRGWCRRHPPAPAGKQFGEFPMVGEQGWCGEFEERTTAKPRAAADRV